MSENPRKIAMKPTQNRINAARPARSNTLSELETQNARRIKRIPLMRLSHHRSFSGLETIARVISNAPWINNSRPSTEASAKNESIGSMNAHAAPRTKMT